MLDWIEESVSVSELGRFHFLQLHHQHQHQFLDTAVESPVLRLVCFVVAGDSQLSEDCLTQAHPLIRDKIGLTVHISDVDKKLVFIAKRTLLLALENFEPLCNQGVLLVKSRDVQALGTPHWESQDLPWSSNANAMSELVHP